VDSQAQVDKIAQEEKTANMVRVFAEVEEEILSAERKFPTFPTDVIHASAIVNEEAGELSAAALQVTYEGNTWEHVRLEAVQTAAMAVRFLLMFKDLESRESSQKERGKKMDSEKQEDKAATKDVQDTKIFTIYGHSDDLIETEGITGCDEFGCYGGGQYKGFGILTSMEGSMYIHCYFGNKGIWHFAPSLVNEGFGLPEWPMSFEMADNNHSILLKIAVPKDTVFNMILA